MFPGHSPAPLHAVFLDIVSVSNTSIAIITTTNTNAVIPLTGLPSATYCLNVVAIDTANREGEKSDEMCFEIRGNQCLCRNSYI